MTQHGLIERVVAAALRQRLFVLFCLAALIGTGIVAYQQLPVEAFPDLTNNQVVVVTEAPALAAPEVEQRITYPIEIAMMGAPNTEQVRSISKFGLSIVTVVFDDAVPIYFARQLVTERLADARGRLPDGVDPVLGPVATAFGEIYQYLIEGGEADPMEIKTLHDWDIRTRLRSVRGVSEVNSWGGLTRQYQIVVDPARLEKHRLSLRDVYAAVAANNTSFSGGYIEHSSERYTVRGVGLVASEHDLSRIVLEASGGSPITVADVASVVIAPMPRQGAVTRDGRGESVAGMVIMLKGENGRDVAARVKARMAEVEQQLPDGLTVVPFYDQSEVITRTSSTVRKNLIEGCLLVTVVLFLFLRDVRAALVVAAVIPLAMLTGFIGMRIFGVSANLMSLGAVDFGLIVDGAVVMMENFVRRRPDMAAVLAAGDPGAHHEHDRGRLFTGPAIEVARPILFGVLIIIAVYIPVFTLEGLEGKMFRPMAITICSALFGALLLSLTAVPVVSSYLVALDSGHHEGAWFERLKARYLRHLEDAMDHRWRTIAVALAVVSIAVGSVPFLGTEFMPRLDEGSILIESRKYPSVSLADSVEISTRVEQKLRTLPEVRQIVTKLGRPDLATEAMGIYQGDIYVQLHPAEAWTTGRETKEELIEAMAQALTDFPGMTFNFTQPMAMRLDEVVSGVKADVAVKVFGPDPGELQRIGDEIRQVLGAIRGSADVQMEILSGAAQVQIDIDRNAIARYGLNVEDVQHVVETGVGGMAVTEVLDGARRFDVVLRFPADVRTNLDALRRLPLAAHGGERIPLERVARLSEMSAPEAINHENGERRIVVQTNVRGRDVGSFVGEASERIAATVTLPSGYYLTWGGQFENQQRAMARLTLVIPLSIAIIFLLLFVTFQRLRQATLVLLNVPFAMIGGIAALWIGGLTLNLSAAVGFIALFGVAVLNGVVLVSAINRLRSHGEPIRTAVLTGASTRLKPVLMTALVEVIGLSPIVLSQGSGAEVQRPFASVISGGIVSATLLTLVVLPTLYEMIEKRVAERH
ncbi:MAG: efflux RND transporter permease subunit [Acidobacteria bacterium]|nr:efflux RND transporter permease subunit [Acidobacteriota bacterium]